MVKQANHRDTEAQRSEAKPAARVHVRRTEPSRRTAKILRDIDRGWTIHMLAGWYKCSESNIYAIARRWGRTVGGGRRGPEPINIALCADAFFAMRQYERAHGLPMAVQP